MGEGLLTIPLSALQCTDSFQYTENPETYGTHFLANTVNAREADGDGSAAEPVAAPGEWRCAPSQWVLVGLAGVRCNRVGEETILTGETA
jgi:hypothetical protein